MNDQPYIIAWESTDARGKRTSGRGRDLMSQARATELAAQLNEWKPGVNHKAVPATDWEIHSSNRNTQRHD